MRYKHVGYTEDGRLVLEISRTKYDTPHQGKRERARRLKQMIKGQQPAADNEANLVTEWFRCKS